MARINLDHLYPVLALALLAAATLWLERTSRTEVPRPTAEARQHPDFIGHQIRSTQFGDDGSLRYIMVADQIRHYPIGDISVFDQLRLHYRSADGLLRLLADRGETREGGDVVELTGNARIFRDGIAGAADVSIVSETLTLWPDTQRAATDNFVTLTQGRSIATADGLRSDNLLGTLELIGNARVSLPPRQPGDTE